MHITSEQAKALGIPLPEEEGDVVPEITQCSTRSAIAPYKSKAEVEYAERLEYRKLSGQIRFWRYEPFSLVLADGVRYRPDFELVHNDGTIEIVEVKGAFVREDARIKFKVAVDKYVEFKWTLAQRKKGGIWETTRAR